MAGQQDRLAIYEVLSEQVRNEVNEIYAINNVFLVVAGGIIVLTVAGGFRESIVHLIAGSAGVLIAVAWHKSIEAQELWKLWWIEELATIENEIGVSKAWFKVARDPKARELDHQPPSIGSVTNPLHLIYYGFGVASAISAVFGIYLLIWK